ncbi:MAG: tail fiber domain-containing protein, partial [Lachnospiraceae bacterium]|nr:tail fiber domain-containing protein [Lachnospiraceae bacterium]
SSSGSGGAYGKNDAEIQIANNMLNALLKSDAFGTQVSDVILDSIKGNKGNFGKLLAHSGIFDSLESGGIKINGDCLTNAVKSNNYNGTPEAPLDNTSGTVIDLTNGSFNFGGGKLKLDDGNLRVEGDVVADSLIANQSGTIAGWKFDTTGFYKVGENGEKQMILGDEGISAGESFSLRQDGKCDIRDIDRLDIGPIHLDKDSSVAISKNSISSLGTDQDKKRVMNYTLDTEGFHIYNGDSATPSTETFADLLIQSLGTGGFLKLGKRYQARHESSISYCDNKADCTCIVDSMGIHGTSKTSTQIGYYHHLMDANNATSDSVHELVALGDSQNDFNPFCVLASGLPGANENENFPNYNNATSFEGFESSDSFDKYIFEYGQRIINTYLLNNTSSSGSQLRLAESGEIVKYASSSKKYKHHITPEISEELNPHRLYSLPVIQFKYNDDYLNEDDQRYGKDIIGFLAEDVYETYPIACNLKDGKPEVPEYNMLIAPMLKLIQEQHEEIENLKQRIAFLEQKA